MLCALLLIFGLILSVVGEHDNNTSLQVQHNRDKIPDLDISIPPGFDDKTYGRSNQTGSRTQTEELGWTYWLVPPFLIGASTVVIVYIIVHSFYFHCYIVRRVKNVRNRANLPSIVISDDQISSHASYAHYSSQIIALNENGELDITTSSSSAYLLHPNITSSTSSHLLRPPQDGSIYRGLMKKSVSLQIPIQTMRSKSYNATDSTEHSVKTSQDGNGKTDNNGKVKAKHVSISMVPIQSIAIAQEGDKTGILQEKIDEEQHSADETTRDEDTVDISENTWQQKTEEDVEDKKNTVDIKEKRTQ